MVSIQQMNTIEKSEEFIGINNQVPVGKKRCTFISLATITDSEQFYQDFRLT